MAGTKTEAGDCVSEPNRICHNPHVLNPTLSHAWAGIRFVGINLGTGFRNMASPKAFPLLPEPAGPLGSHVLAYEIVLIHLL